MTKREFYYLSADGKTNIYAVEWLPEEKPAAVLQIAHGVTEYILRYEPLAEYLTEKGIAVVGNDHLGHGNSIEENGNAMYFGPAGSWSWAVEDLHTCFRMTKEKYPEIPYFILGLSLGSFLVRTWLIQHPGEIDGAVLMGTGQTPGYQLSMVRMLAEREGKRAGENNTTPLIRNLTFENYNRAFRPNRTRFDWLCSDEKALDAYIKDPLRGEDLSAGLFRELLSGMIFTSKTENIKKMDKNLSVLFLSGEKDPVGDFGKGVRKSYQAFQKAGVKDVTVKLYPNARHDILRETCKKEVYEKLYHWMQKKCFK